jgi:hypothetical protein
VGVPGPASVRVTARRKEIKGGWYYEHGSARLDYPQGWHGFGAANDGEHVAGLNTHTRAYRDTDQSLSGVVYFEPFTDHADFPMTPAQLLARVEALA